MLSSAETPVLSGFEAYRLARRNMVEGQLRACGVRDERVLTAMEALTRENFVPQPLQSTAYRDAPIEVLPGRWLLAPMILARLLQAANVSTQDVVLDVAPATGYSTALLASMARDVVGLEADADLCAAARRNLELLQTQNTRIEQGYMAGGWRQPLPYNVILINGCIEVAPEALLAQLAEGGRLVCVFRDPAAPSPMGEARLYCKMDGMVTHKTLFDAQAQPLVEFSVKPSFHF